MTEPPVPDEKRMRLRYAGRCRICAVDLEQGATAIYERASKTVRCVGCGDARIDALDVVAEASATAQAIATETVRHLPEASLKAPAAPDDVVVDAGVAGASARREFERRHARREERVRTDHRKLGGLILAVTDDPQSTRAWDTGALGEERLGARLNELASDAFRVLHDRKIPGTRANIDHIAVTAGGIYVIDAKRYQGRPALVVEGGFLRPRVEKLTVGGRDRTKLVDGVLGQVEVVRGVLETWGVADGVDLRGVLCFIEADWPLIGGAFATRGVNVLWPKKLYPQLAVHGTLDAHAVALLHRTLADALPPA